jgi:glycosyltransferase involved in cell wall biosynthesis
MNETKLKVVMVHNRYLQRGGEDVVFESECALLRENGHNVFEYIEDNHRLDSLSKLAVASRTIWSWKAYRELRALIRQSRPDVVHFHNTFFMISPAAYYACHAAGIPVVQTLHNYRLLCPVSILYRDGHICEECLGKKLALPGIIYGCYHNSRIHTAIVAGMVSVHHMLGTWQKQVDAYIALTEFGRQKFIQGGIPQKKIVVKPNFVHPDPGPGKDREKFALFVGRLAQGKGVPSLLSAWKNLNFPLYVAGAGPFFDMVQKSGITQVHALGKINHEEIIDLMKKASLLIFPSEWYEGMGLAIIEAFSCALPVVVAKLGSIPDLIQDHYTGLHFTAGDPADLAAKVRWAWEHPEEMVEMGKNARREYEEKYTAEKNYHLLMEIYRGAIEANEG